MPRYSLEQIVDVPMGDERCIVNPEQPRAQLIRELGRHRSNSGWRNHPNFIWSQQEEDMYAQQLPQAGQYAHHDCSEPSMSDIMQNLAHNCEIIMNLVQSQQLFQQETQAALGNMGTQITQLATQMNRMQTNQGKLPSQTELNPKESVCAVTCGRTLIGPEPNQNDEEAKHEEIDGNKGHEDLQTSTKINSSKVSGEPIVSISHSLTTSSFASRLALNKKEKDEKEILEDFMKNFVENFRDDELEHVLVSALSEKDAKTEENDAIREIIQLLYSEEEIPIRNLSSSMPIPTALEQKLPSIDLCVLLTLSLSMHSYSPSSPLIPLSTDEQNLVESRHLVQKGTISLATTPTGCA